MQEILITLLQGLQNVLPLSPFSQWLDEFGQLPYLSWLNWFFPVSACLKVMLAWLSAVGAFYLYSIIMRWVKVIGD